MNYYDFPYNLFIFVGVSIIVFQIICRIIEKIEFERRLRNSEYFNISQNSIYDVKNDIGTFGEYLAFEELLEFKDEGALFLMNIYLPTDRNTTTEIDLIMIKKEGIFVIESKNYSGWIFGGEKQKYWTQTLMGYRGSCEKHKFFNPIIQNRNHIVHLKEILGNNDLPIYSIIAFSERCEFKTEITFPKDTMVINRKDMVFSVINLGINSTRFLNEDEMNDIFNKLSQYANVSNEIKNKHIQDIKDRY